MRRKCLAVCVAAALTAGCWAHVGVRIPDLPPAAREPGEELALQVNDAGLLWGDGRLGDEVARVLLASGRFTRVHYPVIPRDRPPLLLRIDVKGSLNEAVAWGVLASVATGFFLFAPAPFMPYFTDLELRGSAALTRADEELERFPIESDAHVTHAIFAPPETYRAKARERVYAAVANQVLIEIGKAAWGPGP